MLKNVKTRIIPAILVIILSFSINIIPASAKTDKVIVGGEPFGLKLYCKGVMVTHFESFVSNGKKVCPSKDSGFKINDIITNAENTEIKSNEQLNSIVKNSKGKTINFKVLRKNKRLIIKTKPELNNDNQYYIGLWARDSCAGIGTISYYNPENKSYGALGHAICDIDTGSVIPSDNGEILKAKITSVTKSKNSNIGTLNGFFTDTTIGNIKTNSPIGIYGNTVNINKKDFIKTSNSSEIKPGKAVLITTINGTTPKQYDIEIINICNDNNKSNRNFVVEIKDKRILNSTGGIVQGMSGSPILQNGKLAGALTHVFLNDCKKGYGIFIENMLNKNMS
jgi:stage IV sporulation protein B